MNFEKLLPVMAPMPPAVVIGLQLYTEVSNVAPADWWFISAGAAVLGTIGTIGVEMTVYKMALRALAEREPAAFIVAVVGAFITSGLIVWTIWRTDDSRPLIVAVIVSIVGYMVVAIGDYLANKAAKRQANITNQISAIEAQTELEKQRAKIANANARAAKFGQAAPVRDVREQREQSEHVTARSLGADKIAAIREYQDTHPGATVRDVAAACGVSNASVVKYGK